MLISTAKKLVSFFFFLFLSFNVWAQIPAATIPAFEFFKLDGGTFNNKSLATNKLLFFCFFDVSCDHCKHAIEKINEHYSEFNNTAIYLISMNNKADIQTFLHKNGKRLPGKKNVTIMQDLQNEFINKFKPRKYPSIFLYSRDKKLLLYDDAPENMPKFLAQIKRANR